MLTFVKKGQGIIGGVSPAAIRFWGSCGSVGCACGESGNWLSLAKVYMDWFSSDGPIYEPKD